jgi:hypothetical protein
MTARLAWRVYRPDDLTHVYPERQVLDRETGYLHPIGHRWDGHPRRQVTAAPTATNTMCQLCVAAITHLYPLATSDVAPHDGREWRSSWPIQARDLNGHLVAVLVGILDDTDQEIALRVGDDGATVLLSLAAGPALICALRDAIGGVL